MAPKGGDVRCAGCGSVPASATQRVPRADDQLATRRGGREGNEKINPRLDSWVPAAYPLGALAPPVLHRLHGHGGTDVPGYNNGGAAAPGIGDRAMEKGR